MIRRAWLAGALLGAALTPACQDRFFAPGATRAGLALSYARASVAGGASSAYDKLDAVHVQLLASDATLLDTTVAFVPGATDTHVPLAVDLKGASSLPVDVAVELMSKGADIFDGSASAMLAQGKSTPVTVTLTPVPAGLTLSPLPTLTALGDTVQASGTVLFATGDSVAGLAPSWRSLSPNVVSATSTGTVVALGEGTGQLQASYGGMTQTANVTVAATVTRIVLSPQNPTARVGDPPLGFSATALDRRGHVLVRTPTFTSSDTTVATVDKTGFARILGAGSTTISAAVASTTASTTLAVLAGTQVAPVLSGLSLASFILNDTACSRVNNGVAGTLFTYQFNYADRNGDVPAGGSPLTVSYTFSSGGSGSFVDSAWVRTGTGFGGSIAERVCTVFGSSQSITLSFVLADAAGLASNAISIVTQRPAGANSMPAPVGPLAPASAAVRPLTGGAAGPPH